SDASRLMLYVHKNGVGVVGLYPFSVAETKVAEVGSLAQQAEVPLLCTIEPDTGDGDGDGGNSGDGGDDGDDVN
ncbi:MAG: ATP-dependent Clp protease adaptor ClpS, partial [Acidobacteria bacterium]|nr:ATP-dependent Clp protease adaptor ClpS [Acidobacteriota bacterium]